MTGWVWPYAFCLLGVASYPGLFLLLNDNENDERNKRTDGQMHVRENRPGIYSIAGVVVRMRQPLPRFWVIIYVCKLLGFSSIFSVYSCILIHVSAFSSAFSEAAPWLLNRCLAFHTLTEAKARRSFDAPLQWFMLYASSSTIYIRFQC